MNEEIPESVGEKIDENSPKIEQQQESTEKERKIFRPPGDFNLKMLSFICNYEMTSISITLSCSGLLVSGYITSEEDFNRFMRERLIDFFDVPEFSDDESKKRIEDLYLSVFPDLDPEAELKPRREFEYIHIKDAHFVAPGGNPIPRGDGLMWRCRIDKVDGFAWGRLASPKPDKNTE